MLCGAHRGYVKDGFIVDEDDEEDDYESEEDDYESEEDEPQPKVKSSKSKSKQSKTPPKKKNATVFDKIDTMVSPEDMNTFLDCSSELVEEDYE